MLIKCAECQNMISSNAQVCPHCGLPLIKSQGCVIFKCSNQFIGLFNKYIITDEDETIITELRPGKSFEIKLCEDEAKVYYIKLSGFVEMPPTKITTLANMTNTIELTPQVCSLKKELILKNLLNEILSNKEQIKLKMQLLLANKRIKILTILLLVVMGINFMPGRSYKNVYRKVVNAASQENYEEIVKLFSKDMLEEFTERGYYGDKDKMLKELLGDIKSDLSDVSIGKELNTSMHELYKGRKLKYSNIDVYDLGTDYFEHWYGEYKIKVKDCKRIGAYLLDEKSEEIGYLNIDVIKIGKSWYLLEI